MSERRKNLLLLAVSVIASYVALEWGWRKTLPLVPLSLHQQLGFLEPLAQSSKAGAVPKAGWIAIVGDSYAEGLGDHLMKVVYDGNPAFNAAHFLFQKTGRDVVTFGARGGFPTWTYAHKLPMALHGINRYLGTELPPPADVMLYWFEGNDISDQMEIIQFGLPEWMDRPDDPDQVERYVREMEDGGYNRAYRRWHFLSNAHLADTGIKLAKLAVKNAQRGGLKPLDAEDPAFRNPLVYEENWTRYQQSPYRVWAGGKEVAYPSPTVEDFMLKDQAQVDLVSLYFEKAVGVVQRNFPGARIWVVYVPSPVTTYRLASSEVSIREGIRFGLNKIRLGDARVVTAHDIAQASDRICRTIEARAQTLGAGFIDTRPALREATFRRGYLHGPNDPGHFNLAGYEELAAILASASTTLQGTPCTTLPY